MEGGGSQVNDIHLIATGLAKEFQRRTIFHDLSFELSGGDSLAITGRNGSGKSTLIKILAGLLTQTRGSVTYKIGERTLSENEVRSHIGLVSPYLQLYDEFTGLENLMVLSRIRAHGLPAEARAEELLKQFGLALRKDDFVRGYSSGMKQRLKYAFALLHRPAVLFLDEPTSNLDAEGIEVVRQIVATQRREGILIVATNDEEEAGWCTRALRVGG
jgi:heme exporter protein A